MGVLILGFTVVVLTVVVGLVDVTTVQLARVRLADVADAAAVDAADELSLSALYRRGLARELPVSTEGVREAASGYLLGVPAPNHVAEWRLGEATGSPDGASARVELVGVVEMPLGNALVTAVTGPVTVHAEAQAQVRIRGVSAGAAGAPRAVG